MEMVSFASHLWSELLCALRERVNSSQFGRKVVIVGSSLVKERVMEALLKEDGVVFGIKVLDLSSAMDFFHHVCGCAQEKQTPSAALLSTHLELVLDICPDMESYLQGGAQKRRRSFADRMAQLFIQYGKYGASGLPEWEKKEGWQQQLWGEVKKAWSFPCELEMKEPPFPVEVHLFGLPYIPELFQRELTYLAQYWSVFAYHFSPSSEYWEDLCTEKEGIHLEHAELGHPLLANFGSIGRKMFDFYQTKNAVSSYPLTTPHSVLSSLQNDIVSLQETHISADHSLQLHSAPSKKDEVEGLLKSLLSFINENPKILPEDIVVYAPDISAYFPYIQFCFGRENSPLGFCVEGLESSGASEYIQGLMHLFRLAEGRWDVQEVLKIFHFSPLLDRFGISRDEVMQIRVWVLRAEVRWGQSAQHRNEVLASEVSDEGTWEDGITRLLFGLAASSDNGSAVTIELSDANLLGKLALLVESLWDDLSLLRTGNMTISAWILYIQCIAKAYFVSDGSSLLEDGLRELSTLQIDQCVKFAPLRYFLEKVFKQKGRTSSRGRNVIRFQSLKSGNVVESKVIWVMGMEEGAFPRSRSFEHLDSLNRKDWAPNPGLEDRYAGLELLLSAKERCVFSYVSLCPQDGKEVSPSLLVTEIEHALEKKGTKFFCVDHPPIPFAAQYFQEDSFPKSFDIDEYLSAKSFYMKEEEVPSPLFPEFYGEYSESPRNETLKSVVRASDLIKLMRNPLQLYFNETLCVYEKRWDRFAGEEEKEFVCSHLDRYLLRQEGLSGDKLTSRLPLGPFREVAEKQVLGEVDNYLENFAKLQVDPADRFSVTLSPHCSVAYMQGKNWILPPLEIPIDQERSVQIHGRVDDLCSQGVLIYQKKSIRAELTALPKILIWAALPPFPGKMSAKALFLDKGLSKTFPQELACESLGNLIQYYEEAVEKGSPLHPLFFEQLFAGDEESAQRVIEKTFRGDNSFLDTYLEWLTLTQEPFAVSRLKELWGSTMEKRLASLAQWVKSGEIS
jgi:exodeoxyribonuclease V gamma subunit